MRRFFFAMMAVGLLWQCQDIQYPEAPENLIGKEKMIEIYTDAYLANASKNFNRTILLREQVALSDYIYKKYDIDSLQYEQSNAFYSVDLDAYKKMFEQVKANIDERLVRVDSVVEVQEELEKKRRDSIRERNKRRRDSLGIKTEDTLDLDRETHQTDTVVNLAKKTIRGEIMPQKLKDSLH